MRRHVMLSASLAAVLSLASSGIATSQDEPTGAPVAAAALPKGEPFAPGFDDLMTLLVQPRHLKLHYAGARRNWELAAAESRNLRSAMTRISRTLPEYLGIDVAEAMEAMMTPQLQAMDAAVAAADSARFASAYDGLTKACNACHVYMERPYIVVKVPDPAAASPYPDQDFDPAP
jgi:hypothetical protein